MNETFTIHSPPGIAGIRIIGLKTNDAARITEFFRSKTGRDPLHDGTGLYYGTVHNPTGGMIDEILLAWDPCTRNAELTFHGSDAVADEITDTLESIGFVHDRTVPFFSVPLWKDQVLDAVRSTVTRTGLLHFLSYLSGGYEQDLNAVLAHMREGRYRQAGCSLNTLKNGWEIRRGFLDPPSVYITGPENAGKSTLFNRIAGYERAVVTNIPGTTADFVEETVSIHGYPFTFVDTAGLYAGKNCNEELADTIEHADWVIYLDDITRPSAFDLCAVPGEKLICRVLNKSDSAEAENCKRDRTADIAVSAREGIGIERILECVYERTVGIPADRIGRGFFLDLHLELFNRICEHLAGFEISKAEAVFKQGFLAA